MTPKEKAEELFFKFYETVTFFDETKQCALIAVDAILKIGVDVPYWQEVKKEIENFE